MQQILYVVLLLIAPIALSQQQDQNQARPPYSSPSIAPKQNPEVQPPDTKAPAQGELSNPEIERQLQKSFAREPMLAHTSIKANVDDKVGEHKGSKVNSVKSENERRQER
jgi:hypothetical protein